MDTHHLLSLNTAKYKTAQCLANKRREGRILYYNMIVHICFLVAFFVIAAMIQNVSTKQCPVTVQKTQTDGAAEQLSVSH